MNRVREAIGCENGDVYPCIEPVSVCILDSGIACHEDFGDRIIDFQDFADNRMSIYDDYGHGTHIAGILAGDGKKSGGKYAGIAPKSRLMIGKVLGKNGEGKIEYLLKGILWCIKYHQEYNIRVLNISVGLIEDVESDKKQALLDAVEHAWDVGIVTLCAAGNNGPKRGSVTLPGTHPKVITVGSVEKAGNRYIPSIYSGRGPTSECVYKPEVYAPGTDIISCSNTGGYVRKTGTSMSVPIVAGGVALLLQKQPCLSPVDIKLRLFERMKEADVFHLPEFLWDKDNWWNNELI